MNTLSEHCAENTMKYTGRNVIHAADSELDVQEHKETIARKHTARHCAGGV